jgi:integrase
MSRPKKAQPLRQPLTEGYIRTVRLREEMFRVWDTHQRGLALRVQPSGVKTFEVAYHHAGRLRWYVIDRYGAIGLKEARDAARIIRAKAALGGDPQGEKIASRVGDTLAQIHERYVENTSSAKKSWQHSQKLMQRYILPKLGNRKLKDVTRTDMWRIFDDLSDRPILANCVLASASAMFNWALKRHLIPDNPCRGIEHHKPKSSKRFLSNDEIRTIWPMLDDLGLYQSSVLKIILMTGQRPGEVCSMRWQDIDLDAGIWSMPGQAAEGWPGTKNHRDHEVPLPAPVLELLRELEPESGKIKNNILHVFPSVRKGKPIGIPSTVSIWQAAGVPRFRPHDLRATCATGMDALGIVRQHISLVLNHVEAGVTQSYVRHDQRQHKRLALEAWARELMAILAGEGRTDHRADVVSIAR